MQLSQYNTEKNKVQGIFTAQVALLRMCRISVQSVIAQMTPPQRLKSARRWLNFHAPTFILIWFEAYACILKRLPELWLFPFCLRVRLLRSYLIALR